MAAGLGLTVEYKTGQEWELVDVACAPALALSGTVNYASASEDESSVLDAAPDLPITVLRPRADTMPRPLVSPWTDEWCNTGNGFHLHVAVSPPPFDDALARVPVAEAPFVRALWFGYRQSQAGLGDRCTSLRQQETESTVVELLSHRLEDDQPPLNFITAVRRVGTEPAFDVASECNYAALSARKEKRDADQARRTAAHVKNLDDWRKKNEEHLARNPNALPIPEPEAPSPLPEAQIPRRWDVYILSLPNLHAARWVAQRVAHPPPDRLLLKRFATRLLVPLKDQYVSLPANARLMPQDLLRAMLESQLPIWRPGVSYLIRGDGLLPDFPDGHIAFFPTHVAPPSLATTQTIQMVTGEDEDTAAAPLSVLPPPKAKPKAKKSHKGTGFKTKAFSVSDYVAAAQRPYYQDLTRRAGLANRDEYPTPVTIWSLAHIKQDIAYREPVPRAAPSRTRAGGPDSSDKHHWDLKALFQGQKRKRVDRIEADKRRPTKVPRTDAAPILDCAPVTGAHK